MAQAFMAKKDYANAISELRKQVLLNPTGASEHRVLGQALLLVNKQDEAVQELQAAVYLGPDSAMAHHYLGTALFELQSFGDAEKEFREAVRLEPTAQNHYSLAACLMAVGRNDEALAELESASRLDPSEPLYRARTEELLKMMAPSSRR
jgi:Flp pilus assembly protein TadD